MTAPETPPAKSLLGPDRPRSAEQAPAVSGRSAPEVVGRKAVPSARRSDPQAGDGRYPIAWLHITAPSGAIPTATSKCACGRDRSAVGHRRVPALIADHEAHKDLCPLRAPEAGRNAV